MYRNYFVTEPLSPHRTLQIKVELEYPGRHFEIYVVETYMDE